MGSNSPREGEQVGSLLGDSWSPVHRVGFRLAFCYFLQITLCLNHKTAFEPVPRVGWALQGLFNWPYLKASQAIAVHLFHLTGAAATPHPSAFHDRALDWISAGLMAVIAALVTVLWTALAAAFGGRRSYPQAWLWLRFLVRLTLAVAMLWYGSIKLWPIQIPSPSLAVLNERVGDLSPMSLLWTLLGSNHTYELLCGVLETSCGLLLLVRRTALVGALTGIVILSNVVLFDFFFGVPVRLYASNLLLMALLLIVPDLRALADLFLRHRRRGWRAHGFRVGVAGQCGSASSARSSWWCCSSCRSLGSIIGSTARRGSMRRTPRQSPDVGGLRSREAVVRRR